MDYITARQFQAELLRSIHAAEEYHVLWLHDYNGKNAAGDVDRVGFVQAVDGYLAALTERVRRLDVTRRLPVFIILLDQKYYEQNDGRLYMDLLEDPLGHRLELPSRFERLVASGATATALEVHNDRGFARRDASLVNSMLYTLMPPGSLIVVPSPIWTDPGWAGQLVGAALRGCDVYVIAPSRDNAPQSGFVTLARSREVFSRFFEIQQRLAPEVETAGGRLRTGLYTRRAGLDQADARLGEVVNGYGRYPFLADEFPLPAAFFDGLSRGPRRRKAALVEDELPLRDVRRREPQMHRKTQFLATRESLLALGELAANPGGPRGPLFRALRGEPLAAEAADRLVPESAWLGDELAQAHRRLPREVKELEEAVRVATESGSRWPKARGPRCGGPWPTRRRWSASTPLASCPSRGRPLRPRCRW